MLVDLPSSLDLTHFSLQVTADSHIFRFKSFHSHIQNLSSYIMHTANVNRQTTDKLLFSHAIITDENM